MQATYKTASFPRMLILADDLSGAADCTSAFAPLGLRAVLALGPSAITPDADVLAIDADTRHRTAPEAAAEITSLVHQFAAAPGQILYKKIDSTLRGQIAAELGALLKVRRELTGERAVSILTPAFPAHGRTVVDGRLLVHGVPLEQTDVWHRESTVPRSSIPEILAEGGLRAAVLGIDFIRSGESELKRTVLQLARESDVLVCDAKEDSDLRAIAEASMALGPAAVWAGSAGLACHLPAAAGWGAVGPSAAPPITTSGATLFVVGSLSAVSREQAEMLAASKELVTLRISPQLLLAGEGDPAWIRHEQELRRVLSAQRDVLLLLEDGTHLGNRFGHSLCAGLAQLVRGCAGSAGSLVATGGETARAILDAWGITQLQLVGEVEKGLPVSVTLGWNRSIAVLTKAGAFGKPETLLSCRRYLREKNRHA